MIIRDYKLFENLQKARKVLSELNLDENNPKYLELRNLLKKNPGYLGQFTKWYLKDNEKFDEIISTLNTVKRIGLDKPIDEFEKLEDLYDYLINYEIERKVNQLINQIPSKARKNAINNQPLKELLSLNIEYYTIIKKWYRDEAGKYKTEESLYNDTKDFIENLKGDFNLDSKLKLLEGKNVDIVVARPDLLMVKVNDFETSCEIGNKYWCISRDRSFWNRYVNEVTTQYFIWDFTKNISDKKHMIGVTIGLNGKIESAQWSNNTSVSDLSYFDDL